MQGINKLVTNNTVQKEKYNMLQSDQRIIVDSINNLSSLAEMIKYLNAENINLAQENTLLKQKLNHYKKRQRNIHYEYEYDEPEM